MNLTSSFFFIAFGSSKLPAGLKGQFDLGTRKLTLGILTLSAITAHGQKFEAEKFEAALLKAKHGALLVYNGQQNSFSIKIISKSITPTEKENFLKVDDNLISCSIIPCQVKIDFDHLEESRQKQFLTTWKQYEKEWIEGQLKAKVHDKEEFVKIESRLLIYWSFDMPKSNDPNAVEKQSYLVTTCFDQMLIMSGPVEKNKSEMVLKDKLFGIAKTLEM